MDKSNDKGYWSEDITVEYHPPEGTFSKDAKEIVNILMHDAKDNSSLALHRLMFYINRAGNKISNSSEVQKAKTKLEDLIKVHKK